MDGKRRDSRTDPVFSKAQAVTGMTVELAGSLVLVLAAFAIAILAKMVL